MVLFHGMFLTTKTKMRMIRQSYNGTDEINLRANGKPFTHKTEKKNNIMFIIRRCKKNNTMLFFLAENSAIIF